MLAKMKCQEDQVRYVRQMKWLEMKILRVSLDEMAPVASTSCKSCSTSSTAVAVLPVASTSIKTNEIFRHENTSCKLK